MRAKPEKALREAARRKGFPAFGCGPKNQHDLTFATAVVRCDSTYYPRAKSHQRPGSVLVKTRLSQHQDEARTLWAPLAEEFDRDGPDDADKQRLVERVQTLLDRVEGSIDG